MRAERLLWLFVLLAAALMFTLELLAGRLLLPSFGGTFSVWATCLAFFQGALLVGYAACLVLTRLPRAVHVALLAAAALALPLDVPVPAFEGTPGPVDVLRALLGGIGAPFVALGTISVAAHAWLATSNLEGKDDPYPLYAASNLGALLGLLAYPLLIEPLVGLGAQRAAWSVGYGLLVLVGAAAALAVRRARPATGPASPAAARPGAASPVSAGDVADVAGVAGAGQASSLDERPLTAFNLARWLVLAACTSALLGAVTNVLTLDVGPLPLLWALPLGVFLATFVLAFRSTPWAPRALRRYWPELATLGVLVYGLGAHGAPGALGLSVLVVHTVVLFVTCLVAHAELQRTRPAARHATIFYLALAAGGWLGSTLVGLVAPRVLAGLHEYPLALAVTGAALLAGRVGAARQALRREPRLLLAGSALFFAGAALVGLSGRRAAPLHTARSDYGLYRIVEDGRVRSLVHGMTNHGQQLRDAPRAGTSYYGAGSPVVEAITWREGPRRAAVLGLGVGGITVHFEPGDRLDYYELDPLDVVLAGEWFSFLRDARAEVRVIEGDARAQLERVAAPGAYDLIVADAFSGDAVPVHLVTREAVALYLDRLAPRGALVFNVTNRFYDLRPVLAGIADSLGLRAAWSANGAWRPGFEAHEAGSWWVGIARSKDDLPPTWQAWDGPRARPWTDDHAWVLGALW